jgi:ERCC4-related helicase
MLDPREYQIELFERAKTHNTIAVLDTGIAFKAGFQRFAPVI